MFLECCEITFLGFTKEGRRKRRVWPWEKEKKKKSRFFSSSSETHMGSFGGRLFTLPCDKKGERKEDFIDAGLTEMCTGVE